MACKHNYRWCSGWEHWVDDGSPRPCRKCIAEIIAKNYYLQTLLNTIREMVMSPETSKDHLIGFMTPPVDSPQQTD